MKKSDFNKAFDQAFSSYCKSDFENWFQQLMGHAHGSEFEVIKPGGTHGDKKSDGRLISDETVFQCYAPESASTFAANAPQKVADSFPGVFSYWPNTKTWYLIHNNSDGLNTATSDKIEEIRGQHPNCKIRQGNRTFLKNIHDKLTLRQLEDVYGDSWLNFADVRMENIRPLLRKIESDFETPTDPLDFGEEPDPQKIDYNSLSAAARLSLRSARKGADIVERYIDGLSRPSAASNLQNALINKYEALKDYGYNSDEILSELLKFVGNDGTPTVQAAAYVIITYYFDACDIFENVPEEYRC